MISYGLSLTKDDGLVTSVGCTTVVEVASPGDDSKNLPTFRHWQDIALSTLQHRRVNEVICPKCWGCCYNLH